MSVHTHKLLMCCVSFRRLSKKKRKLNHRTTSEDNFSVLKESTDPQEKVFLLENTEWKTKAKTELRNIFLISSVHHL